jgi:hypothetical protein
LSGTSSGSEGGPAPTKSTLSIGRLVNETGANGTVESPNADVAPGMAKMSEQGPRRNQRLTGNLLGNGPFHLMKNLARLERLRSNRSIMSSPIEEMLRYEAPARYSIGRFAVEDTKLAGPFGWEAAFIWGQKNLSSRLELA